MALLVALSQAQGFASLTVLAGLTGLTGLAFGGLGLATAVPLLIGVVALATIGEVLTMPVAGALVADIAPDDIRGRYQGGLGAAASLGVAAAPALGGALYGWPPPAAFTAFALASAVAFGVVTGPALRSTRPARM